MSAEAPVDGCIECDLTLGGEAKFSAGRHLVRTDVLRSFITSPYHNMGPSKWAPQLGHGGETSADYAGTSKDQALLPGHPANNKTRTVKIYDLLDSNIGWIV